MPEGDRAFKRSSLIIQFLTELPGMGSDGFVSRYQYNVETYESYSIYLKRPTQLNKGFDFTVNISGLYFKKNRRYSNPSHQDIFNALLSCKAACPEKYVEVKNAIVELYHCKDADLSKISAIFYDYMGIAHPIQILLLAIKWLFMEQDCAYWNYSGRKMLFDALAEEGLI